MRREDSRERAADDLPPLAPALAATDTGVWVWDLRTNRVEWSPTMEGLFGLEPGAFEGTADALASHLGRGDPSAFDERIDEALDGDGSFEFERRVARADGEERWLLVRGAFEREGGEPTRVVGVALDVTDQKERERELRERVERLDQFASIVSHDLRNPLTVAKARHELFEETGDPADLEGLGSALDRIEALATDMLALARHGTMGGDRQPVELGAVAERAWEAIDTREATLSVERGCTVEADADQLRTVFENLFKNAVGHGGADVTVAVGCEDEGFYVEDDGPGIPEAEREKVFEHGYTTGYGGTGAGLTIVRRVAESHDWDVTLREGQRGGARFEFTGDARAGAGESRAGDAGSRE